MDNVKDYAKKDSEFSCLKPLKAPQGLSLERQLEMFYKINLIREFDTKLKEVWMAGMVFGVAHSYVAQEAIAVGACEALRKDDYITSTHRGHGHTIAKGGDVKRMMAELFGKFEGYNRGKGGSMHIADVDNGMLGATGIVGSGMPIALGSALAADRLGNGKVTVCFHGDGATNQGTWHETINMAAAWNLPVIFVIENNQMAIATDICTVTKDPELYKRAMAYGIPGVQADGFNVFDVYSAVKEAVDNARTGKGPSLIECKCLRILGHHVADDQWYRDLEIVNSFKKYDPIVRMREYFLDSNLADADELDAIEKKARVSVEEAVTYAANQCTEPPIESLYDDLYANGEIIL